MNLCDDEDDMAVVGIRVDRKREEQAWERDDDMIIELSHNSVYLYLDWDISMRWGR